MTRQLLRTSQLISGVRFTLRQGGDTETVLPALRQFFGVTLLSNEKQLKVIFHDTTDYFSMKSAIANIYDQPQIFLQVVKIINKYVIDKNISRLEWYGFGLGGMLAQLSLVEYVVAHLDETPMLEQMSLTTLNAPGVDKKSYENFLSAVDTMRNVSFEFYHQMVDYDVLHMLGDNHLLLNGPLDTCQFLTVRHVAMTEKLANLLAAYQTGDTSIVNQNRIRALLRRLHFLILNESIAPGMLECVEGRPNHYEKKRFSLLSSPLDVLINLYVGVQVVDRMSFLIEKPLFFNASALHEKDEMTPGNLLETASLFGKHSDYRHNQTLMEFATGEYLFHHLAYKHLPSGCIVPVVELSGQIASYTVYRLVHEAGYYCYALVPSSQDSTELKLLFQGTDPSELTSVLRDLDRGSAGYKLFKRHRLSILRQINNLLTKYSYLDAITIGGHSLGGADAQNFFVSLLLAYASLYRSDVSSEFFSHTGKPGLSGLCQILHEDCYQSLSQVKKLTLKVYNPAGVRKSSAILSKHLVEYLHRVAPELQLSSYFQFVPSDPVNLAGQSCLFPSSRDKYIKTKILNLTGHKDAVTAHTAYHFRVDDPGVYKLTDHEVYHNTRENISRVKQLLETRGEPESKEFHAIKASLASYLTPFV